MTDEQIETTREAQIRARAAAASGTEWHWAGNIDHQEPYLATWIPGAGRCQVLSTVDYEREVDSVEGRIARDDLSDHFDDPEALDQAVEEWAEQRDTRLVLMGPDLMVERARDLAVYEVAPQATSRQDPKVYRADIVGIRHPDAEFIAHSRADVDYLLAENDRLRAALDRFAKQSSESLLSKGWHLNSDEQIREALAEKIHYALGRDDFGVANDDERDDVLDIAAKVMAVLPELGYKLPPALARDPQELTR
tara:strand:+ start:5370 stop:6122 length:753 start_codon:yes stop_codon:yes gene_type:complete